jgi:threonylcarbamoyladenosine tRNA methylthiotransferase MtaB
VRVAFYTLGCKLNQAETESLISQLGQSEFQVVSPNDVADVYVANTCTVTHIADRKSRHWLRLAKRRNPKALIIATGCYAQRSPRDLEKLADFVADNRDKERLLDLIQTLASEDAAVANGEGKQFQPPAAAARTRSLIKVQDGCQGPCTYCIVPTVRSDIYSRPASQIIEEVRQRVALGYKEVVLTGTKVGSYRDGTTSLDDLVRHILHETGIKRLRLSSLQPSELSPEFLTLWQDERLCRHFHLALQSGSESVLQRMKRSYSLVQYERTLDLIREKICNAAITTDIMVGFPAESDEEFQGSYSFCLQAGFANIHVFPFSPRPKTVAEEMDGQINDRVKQERGQRMLELSRSCRRLFGEQFLGQILPVLFEKESSPGSGIYSGLTGNYIRVLAHSDEPLSNRMAPVRLKEFHDHGMMGEIVP